ncbi:F-box/LRR-repeat protein At3g26922-like [Salvia miltiorrhiza]|uniref:F-box/LRR-repeat protein At3g26922-like n=1 Tax=Salvia miltiorrhiza TaxID=226208 RepID=UPI0025AD9454|nr:F-box/LRR-repeat protein At3g26922-like [Salvia miltiorrhiza]
MENSEPSRSCDRLSQLPNKLIFFIFELLPMNDVVRSTILSKRWKDLWRTAPFLNFTDYSFKYNYYRNVAKVRRLVNRALILWRGIELLKFKIDFRSRYDHVSVDLNVWVRWAKEKRVEEIHLRIKDMHESYELPECLYSCSSLKVLVLSLNCIRLSDIRGNIMWDSLKSLTIESVYFGPDSYFISQALRGSPNLEVFNLTLHDKRGSVFIQSSSLKKLSIRKTCYETDKELEIVTPNLETLEISGSPYRRCVLSASSSSLTDVTLRFQEDKSRHEQPYDVTQHLENLSLENLSLSACCENDCWETLSQILPTIQHVERVKLSAYCIQVLQRTNKQHLLSRPYFVVRDPVEFCGPVWCFDE